MKPPITTIIQGRMNSSRLPGKILQDLGGQPMLVRVVERARRAQTIDQVVVATTTDPSDDPVEALCQERGYLCYRGSLHDVLDRYYQAARRFNAAAVPGAAVPCAAIVRITADCPVIDPDLIDDCVRAFWGAHAYSPLPDIEYLVPAFDFVANRLPPPWKRTYPIGLDVEVCSFAGLERAWKETTEPLYREHVMPFFYAHPDNNNPKQPRFRIRILDYPGEGGEALGKMRWTVDTPEDLEVLRHIYAHFKRSSSSADDHFTWLDVLHLVQSEPEIMQANAQVRHKDYREIDERTAGSE